MKTLLIAAFSAVLTSASVASPLEQLRELGQIRDELRRDRQEERGTSPYYQRSERRDYERRGSRDYDREYDRRDRAREFDDGQSREYDRRSRSRDYDGQVFRARERSRGEAREHDY